MIKSTPEMKSLLMQRCSWIR